MLVFKPSNAFSHNKKKKHIKNAFYVVFLIGHSKTRLALKAQRTLRGIPTRNTLKAGLIGVKLL